MNNSSQPVCYLDYLCGLVPSLPFSMVWLVGGLPLSLQAVLNGLVRPSLLDVYFRILVIVVTSHITPHM